MIKIEANWFVMCESHFNTEPLVLYRTFLQFFNEIKEKSHVHVMKRRMEKR